jgi:hypothetical protein
MIVKIAWANASAGANVICGHIAFAGGIGVDLFSMTGVTIWIRELARGRDERSLIPLDFQVSSWPRMVGVPIDGYKGYKGCKAGTPSTWV